jgi:hypothetical protein
MRDEREHLFAELGLGEKIPGAHNEDFIGEMEGAGQSCAAFSVVEIHASKENRKDARKKDC